MSFSKAIVLTLSHGAVIIATIQGETETGYVLHYPLELVTDDSEDSHNTAYLVRWMPFSQDNISLVNKSGIVSYTICSDKYNEIYHTKKAAYEAALASPVTNEPTSQSDDSDEAGPDTEVDEISDEEWYDMMGKPKDTPKAPYH